jgi:multiple sugar transport system permease protein
MAVLGLVAIVPIYVVLVNITRSTVEINSGMSLIPSTHFLDNWRVLNTNTLNLGRGFRNSFLVATITSVLATYFSAMTAYGLHLYRFPGRRLLWGVILISMTLPASLTFIGFYQFMSHLRLLNSYMPIIIPAIASSGTVFFIRQYLVGLPVRELAEVSRIDGASEFRIFNEISLPIMVPALATQAFFSFLGSWNNFFTPFVLLSDLKLYTLPMMVQLLQTNIHNVDFGSLYLGIAVSIIPIIICYSLCSKFLVAGLTMGSLKE